MTSYISSGASTERNINPRKLAVQRRLDINRNWFKEERYPQKQPVCIKQSTYDIQICAKCPSILTVSIRVWKGNEEMGTESCVHIFECTL